MTEPNTVALASVGAHPAFGCPRRVEQNARTVELGLRLSGPRLQVLHVGGPHAEALRGYLSMGLERLSVLEQPVGADALPVLAEHLRGSRAQLIPTGSQAEIGEDSGMLFFLSAEHLGWPLVVGLAEVKKAEGGGVQVLQALPRGQRRRLRVRPPFVASIDSAASVARQSISGPAKRDEIETHEMEAVDDPLFTEGSLQPARPRLRRLRIIEAKTDAERMKAAIAKASDDTGQVLKDLSAEAGAEAIFELLREEGAIR